MEIEEKKLSEKDIRYNERIEKVNENIYYLETESTKLDDNYFAKLKLLALLDNDEKAVEEYKKLNEIYHLAKEKKDELLLEDENGELNLLKYNLTPESNMYVISRYLDFENFKNLFKIENVNGKRSLIIKKLGIKDSEIARLICDTKNKYLRNALLLGKIENEENMEIPAVNFLFQNQEEIKQILCTPKIYNIEIVKNIIVGNYGDFGNDNLDIILINSNLRILEEVLKDETLFKDKKELKETIEEKCDILKELMNPKNTIKSIGTIKIPQGMTVGVELEMVGPLSYCLYGELISNFKGKEDSTIKDKNYKGVEIVSPKLINENINDSLYMADKLTTLDAFTNKTCGGHIHIGSDYLTIKDLNGNVKLDASKLAWKSFLELWQKTEEIMYKITTKENEEHRGVSFAKPIAPKIKEFLAHGGFDLNNNKWILESKEDLKEKQLEGEPIVSERNFAVNFDNLNNEKNTIEFRLPNGTLDRKELAANIKLFTRLVDVSRDLGIVENKVLKGENLSPDEEILILKKDVLIGNDKIKDAEKFEALMDLLYKDENEKDIYRNRYRSSSFNLEKEIEKMKSKKEVNDFEYGAPLSDADIKRIHELNKKEREKKDTFAQEEVIYRDQDFEKLYMESMRKMPNKFQEVISKLKGFLGKVKEKVIERDR